ncbi:MAG: helix-turn-helix transcriptional regulator [Flavobacterium sp.]|nr:helix-turn-helix transcriptional regulator [Flavobacterium sp.]
MKRETITKQLGLKQQDVATLLGVSRAQWSMFESGKRQLPAVATQKLSELLQRAQQNTAKRKLDFDKNNIIVEHLQRLLKENEYQLATNARKIATLLKKQEAAKKLMGFADGFDFDKASGNIADAIVKRISAKALNDLGNDKIKGLLTLEIRQEVLEHERNLLKMKILSAQGKP